MRVLNCLLLLFKIYIYYIIYYSILRILFYFISVSGSGSGRIRFIGPDPDPLQETLIWIRVPKKSIIFKKEIAYFV